MEEDLNKLKKFISKVEIKSDNNNNLGTYQNAVLICLDAVLSINRQYYRFVVPRISYFQENYSDIDSLEKLLRVLENEKIIGFSKYWNYKHDERTKTLYNLTKKMIVIADNYKYLNELEALKTWAKEVTPVDYKAFNVPGIGLATFQYIRMMLGAKTVKPDVHIKRIVSHVLNKKINDINTITLFEKACNELKLNTAAVEHSLWLTKAKSYENFNKIWKGEKWVKKE